MTGERWHAADHRGALPARLPRVSERDHALPRRGGRNVRWGQAVRAAHLSPTAALRQDSQR